MRKEQDSKRNIVQQTVVQVIDGGTGEVKSEQSSTVLTVGAEPDYIKLYLRDVLHLTNLQPNQSSLLYELLKYLNYENEIILNSTIKKRIADKLNTSVPVIDNALSRYVKVKILQRIGRGTYLANPYLFGRGSWKDIAEKRNKNIQLQLSYSEEGCTISAKIEPIQGKTEEPQLKVVK